VSDYHEPYEHLDDFSRDLHRALTSLKEEIEAVDWYHQRVVLCSDAQLEKVLAHNRDEEIEHACMTLEWLRRNVSAWDVQLRKHLFSSKSDIAEEDAGEQPPSGPAAAAPPKLQSLRIGSLKGVEK
jgi:ferritin-like protein